MLFNLFKSKEKKKGKQYLSLKVRQVIRETPDTVTIYFDQPDPFLDYQPGQFLTVIVDINGKAERRSYSLCTSPFVDPYPGITVKRVKDGVVSNYLNDLIRPGKSIEVMKPMGHFTLDYHSQNTNHFVMVTGGSGITPVMGLIKSILVNEPDSKTTLLYCSRSEEQIIFKNELASLAEKHSDKINIIHNLSQPTNSWTGLKGRLSADKIKAILTENVGDEGRTIRYLTCGPQGLMEATLASLSGIGVREEDVLKENFFLNAAEKETPSVGSDDELPIITRNVQVNLEGQEYEFEVTPDKTILEAGMDEDIDMPYSCQSGLCTACRGKLISGKVKMDEDAGLSQKEIEEGYILCCMSHPLTGDVKVEIE